MMIVNKMEEHTSEIECKFMLISYRLVIGKIKAKAGSIIDQTVGMDY